MTTENANPPANPPGNPGPGDSQQAGFDWKGALGEQHGTYEPLLTTKGWKSPAAALESYANLEKMVGANKVVLPGKDAKPEEVDAFYRQLGRPDKPEDYELKRPDGLSDQVYSPAMADGFKAAAHKAGLTPKQAGELHDWYANAVREGVTAREQQTAQAGQEMEAELRKEFGQAYDQNIEVAKRAARQFGDEAALDALEKGVGGAALIKMFAKIGAAMGEDTLAGKGTGSFGVRTPDEAQRELQRLKADKDFQNAYLDRSHAGHAEALRRVEELSKQAHPKG